MTRNQRIPDRQPSEQPLTGEQVKLPGLPPPPPPTSPAPNRAAPQQSRDRPIAPSQPFPKPATAAQSPTASPPTTATQRQRFRWLVSWKFWLIMTALICTGSGAFALALLFRLPGLPNCPAIFWPLASASLRFECARLAASKQTTKDLLEAITLIDSLPPDHPLREQANELVEQWSQDVLALADAQFNAGKLAEAIAAARQISPKTSAYRLVEERIQRWQAIWAKAETLYKQAEESLRKLDWRQAFSLAVRLLDVDNTYWQTTKYRELSDRITIAREDGNKLGRAQRLADDGGLKNLLDAIKLVESIDEKSYVYQAAQKAIRQFGRKMLDLAQYSLDRQDLPGALSIVSQIPDSANLEEESKDFTILANAQSQVWLNTVSSLEEAISQAQRIAANRPLRNKAQQLIARWQLEIVAVAQLEKARVLAQPGTIEDLKLAVAEASTVERSNPRWREVQRQIGQWNAQIQTVEDRPILDQAEQLAAQGDIPALQAAIAQAEQVGRGRALSKEAQGKIQDWTGQVQQIQDQPYLDRARELASGGDLTSAIAAAEQIKSGRSLYQEAQTDAKKWRNQIRAEAEQVQALGTMQEARRLANSGSPDALASAIGLAEQISGSLKSEASDAINEWSWQLLQVAKSQAASDLPGAIVVAQKIPVRAAAYSDAQQEIQAWKKQLGQ